MSEQFVGGAEGDDAVAEAMLLMSSNLVSGSIVNAAPPSVFA